MAGPISHIVLTSKVFDSLFYDKDKLKFFVGTSFPDIRYITKCERQNTHLRGYTIQGIRGANNFMSGLKFHSYLDDAQNEFMLNRNIYELLPKSNLSVSALKFFEDGLLYHKIKNWNGIIEYFDDVLEEELDFGIEKEVIRRWHYHLQDTFGEVGVEKNIKKFISISGKKGETGEKLISLVDDIKKNMKIVEVVNKFYENLDKII